MHRHTAPSPPARHRARTRALGTVALALLGVLLLSGCTVRTQGAQMPPAHDTSAPDWLPLRSEVLQSFIVAGSYEAARGREEGIQPAGYQRRLDDLPEDASGGELVELRVGVRHGGSGPERQGPWDSGSRLQLAYDPDNDLRFPLDDPEQQSPADAQWLQPDASGLIAEQTFSAPYAALEGVTFALQAPMLVSPGTATIGPDTVTATTLPDGTIYAATIGPGATVEVLGSEGIFVAIRLSDGSIGYAWNGAFANLPRPEAAASGALIIELLDSDGAVIRSSRIESGDLRHDPRRTVRWDNVGDSIGRTFTLRWRVEGTPAIGLRLLPDDPYADGALQSDPTADIAFRPRFHIGDPLLDIPLDQLERDDDWLIVRDLPDLMPRSTVRLTIVPGDGPDADDLQFAIARDRWLYGTWGATNADRVSFRGALFLQTRYERDVDLRGTLGSATDALRDGVSDDAVFAGIWLLLLGTATVGGGWLLVRRPTSTATNRGGRD